MNVPGLVDLQVNGHNGVDFSSASLDRPDFEQACRALIAAGTTAFLPTVITSPTEVYRQNLAIIAEVMDQTEFRGRILGIHIEGPFISPEPGARGAHNPDWVRAPDIDYCDMLIELARGKIKLMTIAAGMDGAADLARHASDRGIVVSLGHQLATADDLAGLVESGARALTHLGNGVPAVVPKFDNPIWAGLANDDLYAMLITDGHHLPPQIVTSFIRAKGVSRSIVVSDAAPIAGLPPGRYTTLGNDVVLEETGRLYNPHTGYLVGSSATMIECMNYLASLELLEFDELCMVGYRNPLDLIGIEPGSVQPGKDIVFDDRDNVFMIGE